jgi:protein SCO1/2
VDLGRKRTLLAGAAAAAALERAQGRLAAWLLRPWFWLLVLGLPFLWPWVHAARHYRPPPDLPVHGRILDFDLVDQRGESFTSSSLRGKVWIASFVFTRCPNVCPRVTRAMAGIQHRTRHLGHGFHLVSFTVDPAHDTPEVLAAHAHGARASPRMWTWLTGATLPVEESVVRALRAAGKPGEGGHQTHLVLVDPGMRVRGFYDASEEAEMGRIVYDAGQLVNREP